jgi:hypothetical protein
MSRFASRQQIQRGNGYAYDLGVEHAKAGKHENPYDRLLMRSKYFEYEEGHRTTVERARREAGEV